jgi:uncharacterized protein YigA (DUF484 family)
MENTAKDKTNSDLIDLIKDNPDIFQEQPELLEMITLSDNRGTASLLERQINILKGRLQSFKSAQSELIEVARENEQISDSFTAIICQLIGFTNLSEFASEFPKSLRTTFDINEVSFKTAQAVQLRPDDNIGYEDAFRRLSNGVAVCDNRWPENISNLFFSGDIQSAALIPMYDGQNGAGSTRTIIGILGLGSIDKDRYTNELGTAHLNRLGTMAGICLSRLLPQS